MLHPLIYFIHTINNITPALTCGSDRSYHRDFSMTLMGKPYAIFWGKGEEE
jgi:hypothetical protein